LYLGRRDRQAANLAALDLGHGDREVGAEHHDLATDQVGHRGRVFDLVQQLRGAGQPVDASTGAIELADHGVAIRIHVGERKDAVGQVGHVEVPRIGDVAAGNTACLRSRSSGS